MAVGLETSIFSSSATFVGYRLSILILFTCIHFCRTTEHLSTVPSHNLTHNSAIDMARGSDSNGTSGFSDAYHSLMQNTGVDNTMYRLNNGKMDVPLITVNPSSNLITEFTPVTLQPSTHRCTELLQNFGQAASKFTNCAVLHSRPLHFCVDCVNQYLDVKKTFNDILVDKARCDVILLRKDKIMITDKMYEFVVDVWEQSNCDGCFTIKSVNQTTVYEVSADMLQFESIFVKTTDCFFNSTMVHHSEVESTTSPANNTVCHLCQSVYRNLTTFFLSLGSEEEICMDIVDSMNYTQYLWSKQFDCRRPVKEPILIIALSVFFCILPVIFYGGSRIHTVKKERKLVKQKQLRDMTSIDRDS
ncbi:osteopetrosis-associated transmembrane protein 1-like [Saccoglossus kowalevskii]|uniref:Osteopetrosis-associated transmembrane protein 1-like n=1 Tax=Saccoglossus kowalevskii TaxID=10224 RepID=A0ABM0MDW7_SACKO|nr:PREDICTED: osteopetrosis-associated transmembrane protein 1-like [Saccoglossus kowalevskii]